MRNMQRVHEGFTLPTVVVASVAMLAMLLMSFQLSAASSNALRSQYYQQLSNTAAEAGVARATECIEQNNGTAAWSNAKPLTASTDCAGNVRSVCTGSTPTGSCFVAFTDTIRSNYSVGLPDTSSGSGYNLTAIGSVDQITPSGSVASQVARGSASYMSTITNLPKITGGAGWALNEHIAVISSVDNKLYGFGHNGGYQITNNLSPSFVSTPREIALPDGVTSVSKMTTSGMGTSIICIIGNNDKAYCRGQGLDFFSAAGWKQLTFDPSVSGGSSLKMYDIVVNGHGGDNVCVLAATSSTNPKSAYCMGFNAYGLLGINSTVEPTSSLRRFNIPSDKYVKKVVTQTQMTCVLTVDELVYCAGRGEDGVISGSSNTNNNNPVQYVIPDMGSGSAKIPRKARDLVIQYHADEGYAMAVLATDGTIWVSGARTQYSRYSSGTRTGITGNGQADSDTESNTGKLADLFGLKNADGSSGASGGSFQTPMQSGTSGCLAVVGSAVNNASLTFSNCVGAESQRWMLLDVAGHKAIWHVPSGRCVDVPSAVHGGAPQLYDCNNWSSAQLWDVETVGSGIKLKSVTNPAVCLGRSGGSNSAVMRKCDSGSAPDFQPPLHTLSMGTRANPWRAIIAMQHNFCGLRDDDTTGIWCSGDNNYGQMANYGVSLGGGNDGGQCVGGAGSTRNVYARPGTKVDISKLSQEWQYQVSALQFIATDGKVYGAGRNYYGKLGGGIGSLGDSTGGTFRQCNTVEFQLPSGVTALDMSTRDEFSTYVLGSDGNIYASGLNNLGQLGDGSTTNRSTPVRVKLERTGVIY